MIEREADPLPTTTVELLRRRAADLKEEAARLLRAAAWSQGQVDRDRLNAARIQVDAAGLEASADHIEAEAKEQVHC